MNLKIKTFNGLINLLESNNQYSHSSNRKVLLEKIVGNTGWVYHRTKNNPSFSEISLSGIKKERNQNAMYGKGLYCCYDLSQQLKSNMIHQYGKYILKGKIDLNNFAILDKDIYYISNPNKSFEEHLIKIGTNIDEIKKVLPYTSEIAVKIWRNCKLNGYNGIIFTGQHDGKVAVIWNRQNFIPYQYSEDDAKSWKNLKPDISSIKRPYDNEYDFDPQSIDTKHLLRQTKIVLKHYTLDYSVNRKKYNELGDDYDLVDYLDLRVWGHFNFDFTGIDRFDENIRYIVGETIESVADLYIGHEWYNHNAIQDNYVTFDLTFHKDEINEDNIVELIHFLDDVKKLDSMWEKHNREFSIKLADELKKI